jgi:bifunctional non-homologous end joining protein LigD
MALPVLYPMLATLGPLPSDEDAWAYEIKWDGIRALAYVEAAGLRLQSRNGIDISERYPELAPLAAAAHSREMILDGEIVAFDDDGLPRFERLQPRMNLTNPLRIAALAQSVPVVLEIFDLLWLDDGPLLRLPYLERRERLAALALNGRHWQTTTHRLGGGREFLAASRERGLEGIIAKRPQSTYEPGRRTRAWVKVKNTNRQEFVIAGWVPGAGRREQRLGALLVGYYDRDADGRPVLRYAGKVGTGFTEAELDRLQRLLEPLAIESSPFTGPQPEPGARFVRPQLVAEVEFTEWTRDGMLRHPSYKGLRDDKDPTEVVREVPSA